MKILYGLKASRVLKISVLAALVGLFVLTSGTARATLLNLPETYPDIFSAGITVDYVYSSSTRTLTTTNGYPCQFTYPTPGNPGQWVYHDPGDPNQPATLIEPLVYPPWPVNGFAINMTLDANNQPTGGTLEIRGYIPDLQGALPPGGDEVIYPIINESILLQGTVAQFGYNVFETYTQDNRWMAINTMELIFNSTGGFLQERFFPGQIGINLSWNSFTAESTINLGANFNSDTEESMQSVLSDLFVVPIPEPCSGTLLFTSLGSVILVYALRRLRRSL